jgi:arsenate reductase (thioredoxin)
MAEGFAKHYGADVMEVGSAGLSPASIVQPLTKEVMLEKNINIDGQVPKDLSGFSLSSFDLLINMSGVKLPGRIPIEMQEWKVEDPIGRSPEIYREVRDQIETLVMRLILELRREEGQRVRPGTSSRFSLLRRRSR